MLPHFKYQYAKKLILKRLPKSSHDKKNSLDIFLLKVNATGLSSHSIKGYAIKRITWLRLFSF